MDLGFLKTVLFGLISGLAEFLPISSQGHRMLVHKVLGLENSPLLDLLVHLGALAALAVACRGLILRIRREQRILSISPRRRKRRPDRQVLLDLTLVKAAFYPCLLAFPLFALFGGPLNTLPAAVVFFILNGLVLFLPQRFPSGNKDSRSMSRLDALLMGLGGAVSVLPGLSLVGAASSVALMRGADRQNALSWSLLLSLPVLMCYLCLDIYGIVVSGFGAPDVLTILFYLFAAAAAYGGAYIGISVMRFLAVRAGFSGFAYYSWGASLFAFILYMAA